MMRILLIMLGLLVQRPPVISLLLLLGVAGAAEATTLSAAAAAMAPGTLVEFTAGTGAGTNFNNGALFTPIGCAPGCGISTFEYANKAAWNPVAKRFQHVGQSHQNINGNNTGRGVYYDDATNTWGQMPDANLFQGLNDPRHVYDENTIDSNGTHYTNSYGSRTLWMLTWNAATAQYASSWTTTTNPIAYSGNVGQTDTWFAAFQGGGRVFHWDGTGGLFGYRPSDGNWAQYASALTGGPSPILAGGSLLTLSHYSAACNCLLFGGGSFNGPEGGPLYKMDTAGNITQMSLVNGPHTFQSSSSNGTSTCCGTSLAVDPVSGFLIAIDSNGVMKQFDPRAGTGTWTTIPVTLPAFFSQNLGGLVPEYLISVGIPDYGVIMYIKSNGSAGAPGSTRVFLYKHRPSQSGQGPSSPNNVTTH